MEKKKVINCLISLILLFLLISINLPRTVIAQTDITSRILIVTTTADSGEGSLRSAIANAKSGDTIHFDPVVFAKDVPESIVLKSVLPYLEVGSITIDGIGSGVILDGRNLVGEGGESENPFISGLIITSDGNVIKNLTIKNFPGNGILIYNAHENIIGGDGNSCGIPCNVISSNQFSGIYVEGGSDNVIQGNYLGVDRTGSFAEGNGLNGVRIMNSKRNIIGGITNASGNLMGGNSIGLEILESESEFNTVEGNIIGLDRDQKKTIGNIHAGISIAWSTHDNHFENNIIAGNEMGIVLEKDTFHNSVINNFIGTNTNLDSSLGNGYTGVIIASGHDNFIGPGNKIMWNKFHGVVLEDSYNILPTGNRISENDISNNLHENIYLSEAIKSWLPIPHDLKYSNGVISGYTVGNQVVEIYTDSNKPGGQYIATVTANNRGYFYWPVQNSVELKNTISALSFDKNGSTSLFSNAISESDDILATLPGVVGPAQVSTEPKVLYLNFIFAVLLLGYCKVMTNLFNKTLKKYGELISKIIIDPIQLWIEKTRKNRIFSSRIFKNRWVNWFIFLCLVALIQTWLNPSAIKMTQRLSLAFSIFICGCVIGLIKEMGERIARQKIKQPFIAESTKVHWFGIIIAGISTAFSRLIHFSPGFILGSVEVFSYKPSIQEKQHTAYRILMVRGAIFIVTLIGWLVSSLAAQFSTSLGTILQMIFTVAIQSIFFELLPFISSMDGSKLIRWNFWAWLGLFLPVSYFTFWLVLNPNGSGIKAIQQNSIATLIYGLSFLAVMVFVSDFIFKRLELKNKSI